MKWMSFIANCYDNIANVLEKNKLYNVALWILQKQNHRINNAIQYFDN